MNTRWRDVEGMSYLADRPSSFPKAFDVSMIYPQTRPSQPLPFIAGIRESRLHPFTNNGPLKFGKGSQQVKQQLPSCRGAIQLLVEGHKRHAEALELIQGHDEVLEATAEPVQPPDQHHIDLSPTAGTEESI